MSARPVGSVSFDRAADYYDTTRALPPEVADAQTRLLLDEIGVPVRRVLEIGVGTGRISAPLAARHRVVGVDLSREMLRVLAAKESGIAAVEADAGRLPFRSGAFDAVMACHVLHLVRDWQRVIEEAGRALVPGGVLMASRGRPRDGLAAELDARIQGASGQIRTYIGLDDLTELDTQLAAKGWAVRRLPEIPQPTRRSVADYLDLIESNRRSWTWSMTDEERISAVREVRAWVTKRFGDPGQAPLPAPPIRWHAYRRP
jgi:ubiquinone/menaquinone biosynthesis C-methylase UbiE